MATAHPTTTPAVAATSLPPRPSTDPFFYGFRLVERTRDDGTTDWEQVPLTEEDILHPQDGDVIGQNEAHDRNTVYLKLVIRRQLTGVAGVRVLHDHLIDFGIEGHRPLCPDVSVMVDAGSPGPYRGIYSVREMQTRILLIVEVTSPSTRTNDLDRKVIAYGRARVPLYIIADQRESADGHRLDLMAYRVTPEGMVRVESEEPNRVFLPPPINLWLTTEGEMLVCLDEHGNAIGDYLEVVQEAEEERRRADEAEQRERDERHRADEERRRADEERRRADEAEQRERDERRQREEAQRRLQELEGELRRLRDEG